MKTLVIRFITVMSLLASNSCNNNDEEIIPPYSQSARFNYIDLIVKDSKGNNLLYRNTFGNYTEDDIKVFYYDIKGQLKQFYNSNLQAAKGFIFSESDLRLFLTLPRQNETKSKTLVQFGSNSLMEFEALFEIREESILLSKVWVNDKLVWDKIYNVMNVEITITPNC